MMTGNPNQHLRFTSLHPRRSDESHSCSSLDAIAAFADAIFHFFLAKSSKSSLARLTVLKIDASSHRSPDFQAERANEEENPVSRGTTIQDHQPSGRIHLPFLHMVASVAKAGIPSLVFPAPCRYVSNLPKGDQLSVQNRHALPSPILNFIQGPPTLSQTGRREAR
ncbi:unnamed protein product [Microthlaspi erraticum]|uniref:Uncharacterized protein n=1 Tax=Microthlaspi erraticum TaxID=1685480 RepID=A0A6D2JWB5_9BRAS|nr:unnamed protein product [Microthlaspi erraticum]CAA7046106.1 unnamed protein product [Microthlaspi erraticum]